MLFQIKVSDDSFGESIGVNDDVCQKHETNQAPVVLIAYRVNVTREPPLCESCHAILHDSQVLLSDVPLSETCGYEGGRIPILRLLQQLMPKVRTL